MASVSNHGRPARHRRGSRQGRTIASDLDDDMIATPPASTCIDLTVDVSGDDIIDLTRGHNLSIMDSPVVLLTPADDVGPIRRRRGSGRRGRRRLGSGSRQAGSSSATHLEAMVHVLPSDDSDNDGLPDVPFVTSSSNSVINNSILQSPEGVKISCPVCMDDTRQIRHSRRQVMSTTCGHIFCDTCIKTAISTQHACPTCRKKLTQRSIHPLFL